MSLTGSQHEQIQNALLAAFDEDGLRALVKFELDQDLDRIAGGRDLEARVFALVEWTEKHGCVPDLVAGALRQNPTSPDLIALVDAAAAWRVEAPEPTTTPPYKGLEFYDVVDAPLYFGREALTVELVAYLRDHRFLAVVGASGSGKSSLMRAGMVTALQKGEVIKGSDRWAVCIVTPTARPLTKLAAALTKDSESVTAQSTLMDDMAKDSRSLDLFAARLLARAGVLHLLLVVDQFEELFTLCRDAAEQKQYIDNLLVAAAPEGCTTVVLTLRADFYALCARFDNLRQALSRCQNYIGPMSREELRATIEQPAAQQGWDFEPGLVDAILEDVVGEAGALPLLSHALLETWKRRSGRTMTFAGYHAVGGVQGAIAQTAEAVYADLPPEQQDIARNIFLRLTTLGEGTQDTRRRASLSELLGTGEQVEHVRAVLKRLADDRLVTAERVSSALALGGNEPEAEGLDAVYVDVTHEALIREWLRLAAWLNEDREGLLVHRRLTEAAKEWEELGHDSGLLFRGVRLVQTTEWASAHAGDPNDLERAFLGTSQEQVDAERQERERVQREREEAQKRALEDAEALAEANKKHAQDQAAAAERLRVRNRWLRAALGAAAVALVLAGFFFLQARQRAAEAQANADLANAQLQALEGEQLVQEARRFKADLNATAAISYFEAAYGVDPKMIVLSEEISDTLRFVAASWVQQAEALMRKANNTTSLETREQSRVTANRLLQQAIVLNPPSDTPVYVWVEGGSYLMGSEGSDAAAEEDEKPLTEVQINGFWIGRTEVTNEQYKRCVDADYCIAPQNERWKRPQYAKEPATSITWEQARQYAAWVGGRLPTEAEWEIACRGPNRWNYSWGDDSPSAERTNYSGSRLATWTNVGDYPAGANGLYDMSGNVWEWTSSKYQVYPYKANGGREFPVGDDERVIRGGSFLVDDVRIVRCATRDRLEPAASQYNVGFRVVQSGQ